MGGKKKKKGEYIARGIYFPKYYGKGGGKWLAGKKNEIEELGEKNKKGKEKGRKKGRKKSEKRP